MKVSLGSVQARYGVALAAAALAILARATLAPLWGVRLPFLTLCPAVAVAAWAGGLGPGLLTTAISVLAADFLWVTPRFSFRIADWGDFLAVVRFLANRLRPDVALIDIGLPGLDGYAVARNIRGTSHGAGMHLVALTGYGQAEDRRRAEEAGFDAHLVKPVDREWLEAVLAAARGRLKEMGPGARPELQAQSCPISLGESG